MASIDSGSANPAFFVGIGPSWSPSSSSPTLTATVIVLDCKVSSSSTSAELDSTLGLDWGV